MAKGWAVEDAPTKRTSCLPSSVQSNPVPPVNAPLVRAIFDPFLPVNHLSLCVYFYLSPRLLLQQGIRPRTAFFTLLRGFRGLGIEEETHS
jgi:hypothetical protein